MKDHLEFINTHPNLVGFLMGLLISMEEKGEDRNTIKGLKVALFGPIAGIGDAIFWFTLLPIMAGICSSFASQGTCLGRFSFSPSISPFSSCASAGRMSVTPWVLKR
jgi:PTS system galactosamine-specific IID component